MVDGLPEVILEWRDEKDRTLAYRKAAAKATAPRPDFLAALFYVSEEHLGISPEIDFCAIADGQHG